MKKFLLLLAAILIADVANITNATNKTILFMFKTFVLEIKKSVDFRHTLSGSPQTEYTHDSSPR